MITVEVLDKNNDANYFLIDSLLDVPKYIDSHFDQKLAPFKFKSVFLHKTKFPCEYIYMDKQTKRIVDIQFGQLPFMSIFQLFKSNSRMSTSEVNEVMNDVIGGYKSFIFKNDGSVCIIINPYGEKKS